MPTPNWVVLWSGCPNEAQPNRLYYKRGHAEVLSETQFAGMAKIVHTKIVHTKIAQLINFGLLKITNYEIINIMVIQEP